MYELYWFRKNSSIPDKNVLTNLKNRLIDLFNPLERKRYSWEVLSSDELFQIINKEGYSLEGYKINIHSLDKLFISDAGLNRIIKSIDFSWSILNLSWINSFWYTFVNCFFNNVLFENLSLRSIFFQDCFLENIEINTNSVNDFILSNCIFSFLNVTAETYFSEKSCVKVSERTLKSCNAVPSIDFELEILPSNNKKINKFATFLIHDFWEIKEIKALIRKAWKNLLSIVFLENYKIWKWYLYKDVIYTLGNVREIKDKEQNNFLNDPNNLLRQDLLRYFSWSKYTNIFYENDNNLIIDTTNWDYQTELFFKLVRPISLDTIWFRESFSDLLNRNKL